MNKTLIWACVIKNSIAILVWVALAIIFHKWWIALFAALFLSDVEIKYQHHQICDGCGNHGPGANSHNEALDKAKEAGWLHIAEGDKDYCPDCRKEIK